MVDNKLDLKKKIYITDDKSENYKHFYEKGHGEQLNFDFSDMNSLLHRQSKMIS
jgi:hypothetical protein